MKLSEAIRLGSMISPQAFGVIGSSEGTCALGGAFEAAGLKRIAPLGREFPTLPTRGLATEAEGTFCVSYEWFRTLSVYASCPGGCACKLASTRQLCSQIPHLNDVHRWSRERIADWVHSIELRGEIGSNLDETQKYNQRALEVKPLTEQK